MQNITRIPFKCMTFVKIKNWKPIKNPIHHFRATRVRSSLIVNQDLVVKCQDEMVGKVESWLKPERTRLNEICRQVHERDTLSTGPGRNSLKL